MGRKRCVDERQLRLPFEMEVQTYCAAARSILEHAKPAPNTDNIGTESEIEFNVGRVSACKEAIRRSGMSREQVLDRANALFGRSGTRADDEAKRPLSLNMLNNYLSKPTETVLPPWVMHAICEVTNDIGPYQWAVAKLGGVIISGEERKEMLLGKLDQNIRAGQRLKRELLQQMRRNGAAQLTTEDMDHGKEEQAEETGGNARSGNGRDKRGTNGGTGHL